MRIRSWYMKTEVDGSTTVIEENTLYPSLQSNQMNNDHQIKAL